LIKPFSAWALDAHACVDELRMITGCSEEAATTLVRQTLEIYGGENMRRVWERDVLPVAESMGIATARGTLGFGS